MSSDSSQWPSPAVSPDFVYVLKIGDFQHVLRPADHKASENLVLAQVAVGNIDRARNLLTERGPFLLAEKQQKMDELITDTEEAIERVIKLLTPARVEQISDESIRINTKNAWILQLDEPKAAATFGRLQITHNKLKTVLHDLKNIAATAQLDNCEVRANSAVGVKPTTQTEQPQEIADSSSSPKAGRRSRKGHKQGVGSDASSVSRLTSDEHDTNDARSPISSAGNTLISLNNAYLGNQRDNTTSLNSFLRADAPGDDGSDISTERLPAIPELDSASSTLKSNKLTENINDDVSASRVVPKIRSNKDVPKTTDKSAVAETASKASLSNANTSNAPGELTDAAEASPNSPTESDLKRDSFSVYRRKARESRQEPKANMSAPILSPPTSRASQQWINQPETANSNRYSMDISAPVSAISRESWASVGQPAVASHDPQVVDRNIEDQAKTASQTTHHFHPAAEESRNHQNRFQNPNPEQQATAPPQPLQTSLTTTQTQILSPSRTQLSPQAQTPSTAPDLPSSANPPPDRSQGKTHEIFLIDPVLTRLPTLLRAGQKGRSNVAAPYPVSDAESDNDTEQLSQVSALRPTQSATQQPMSSSSKLEVPTRATYTSSTTTEIAEEHPHYRSFSDGTVPQINVTRAPTIVTRKPLPHRNSMLTGGTMRLQTKQEHSPVLESASEPPKRNSGPPSPLEPGDQNDLPPRASSNSIHSLSVQGPSSKGSSSRSSISTDGQKATKHPVNAQSIKDDAPRPRLSTEPQQPELSNHNRSQPQQEEHRQPGKSPSPTNRTQIPNPLTMHPVAIARSQPSAYQTQSEITTATQTQGIQPPIEYRSPTLLQNHQILDPRYNVHLTSAPFNVPPTTSRFRDEDQSQRPQFPNRSQTVPDPPLPLDESLNKPRRASEQGQTLSSRNFPPYTSPSHPAVKHQVPPGSEGPGRHVPLAQITQEVSPKPNSNPLEYNRTGQGETTDSKIQPVLGSNLPSRSASIGFKAGHGRNRDRDLFRQHRWLQNAKGPVAGPQSNEVVTSPNSGQQNQQQWANRQPFLLQPNQNQPLMQNSNALPPPAPNAHANHPHDCHCDDQVQQSQQSSQAQVQPRPQAQPQYQSQIHPQGRPAEIQRINLTPIPESQRQKPFSSTYRDIDIPEQEEFYASGALQVEGQAHNPVPNQRSEEDPMRTQDKMQGQPQNQMQLPILGQTQGGPIRAKKRSNWLSHQASRFSKERRLQGV